MTLLHSSPVSATAPQSYLFSMTAGQTFTAAVTSGDATLTLWPSELEWTGLPLATGASVEWTALVSGDYRLDVLGVASFTMTWGLTLLSDPVSIVPSRIQSIWLESDDGRAVLRNKT